MQTFQLVSRNLTHYWRTNLAVVLGVATAVAVLAGALLVGDSVRASLRDLVVQRLGQTDYMVTSNGFFREQLAADIRRDEQFAAGGFAAAYPMVALEATVTHEANRRVGSAVKVYGVDEDFWKFHKLAKQQPPRNGEVLLSEALARELETRPGDSLVVRVQKPSDIPVESLHSKKEDLGSTLRLTVREVLAADALGEFSLQPQQSAVRAVFVPLKLLQEEINQPGKVNLMLLAETSRNPSDVAARVAKTELLGRILKERTTLADFGITLRIVKGLSEPPAVAGGPSSRRSTVDVPGANNYSQEQPILAGTPFRISLDHDSKVIGDSLATTVTDTAVALSLRPMPVLSYLANSIASGDRSIPYSLVTALDEESFDELRKSVGAGLVPARNSSAANETGQGQALPLQSSAKPESSGKPEAPIILNEWAARDLGAKPGEVVSLHYYLWHEGGRLETKTAQFSLAAIVPLKGLAADQNLVPEYPGITGSEDLAAWDPPFPVELKRVRKQDEDYWDQYRTTPKAFVQLSKGQELWQSRFGKLTSLRIFPATGITLSQTLTNYEQKLKAALDPATIGFTVIPVRAQGLDASRGATDFGEYFLYFSFFLVISALLLTALFFKLGIEQRLREIGVLQAVGFPASKIRSLFLIEGLLLAVAGCIIGLVGALAYGELMMLGLRTWWVDAVGTTMLRLHVSPLSLLLGAVGGILAALFCVAWTLRGLRKQSTRSLLTGTLWRDEGARQTRRDSGAAKQRSREMFPRHRVSVSPRLFLAGALSFIALSLLAASALHLIGQTPGFFGGGMLLLVGALCFQSAWLRRGGGKSIAGAGRWAVARLGFRNATYRPGRSVVCIALIASAAFIIVSVDAFRRGKDTTVERASGTGGFPLLAESLLPIVHDPNTPAGQEALNLASADSPSTSNITMARFRVRPGDDASCLNLYQPKDPKILAPADDFVRSKRFAFQSSLAASDAEKDNPWLLLNRRFPDGAVPVIADANSMNYVLHLKLGEDLVLPSGRDGQPIRLRLVAALADSIFQSELMMAEKNFLRLFPGEEGYRFFLIETKNVPGAESAVAAALEDRLSDFGFDVMSTGERLASFHRVENTYLSTFQMLGGLGLLLGTLGMAAVLLRNVLERRRELALLRAVGYNSSHFTVMIIAENAFLLCCGLITGTVCALLAIAPVFFSRPAHLGSFSLGLLLLAVLISGLTASIVATWAALRAPLLPALRAE